MPTPFKADNDEVLSELSTLDARLAESSSPRGQRQRFIFSLYGKDKPPDLDKHTELSDDEKYHICKLFMGPDRIVCALKIALITLPINLNMCFGCSKEPSH